MTTKSGISKVLKAVGEYGYDGMVLKGTSRSDVLAQILGEKTESLQRVSGELRRQRLLEIEALNDHTRLTLTPAGAFRLLSINASELTVPAMKTWDKKWRLVTFDIPASKTKERQYFYKRLKALGYIMVQKSMWFHPFDCTKTIDQLADYCGLSKFVFVFEISRLDPRTERALTRHFENIISF